MDLEKKPEILAPAGTLAAVWQVIAAGAENAHVPAMLGWERADNLTEAIAMARSYMGNSAEITMLHQPMIGIADME